MYQVHARDTHPSPTPGQCYFSIFQKKKQQQQQQKNPLGASFKTNYKQYIRSILKHIPLTLSIYLPIRLNPRGGHQPGSGEPSAGG